MLLRADLLKSLSELEAQTLLPELPLTVLAREGLSLKRGKNLE